MVAQCHVGFCAGVVWGSHSGSHGGSAWGVLGGFGMGGRGWCRAWAGPGASGGWTARLFIRMITLKQ